MIHLFNKMFQWNAALASTHGKRDDPQKDRSQNWKQRSILGWRKIIHQKVLLGLLQECLDASLQFLCTKSHVGLRIGIPWSW